MVLYPEGAVGRLFTYLIGVAVLTGIAVAGSAIIDFGGPLVIIAGLFGWGMYESGRRKDAECERDDLRIQKRGADFPSDS